MKPSKKTTRKKPTGSAVAQKSVANKAAPKKKSVAKKATPKKKAAAKKAAPKKKTVTRSAAKAAPKKAASKKRAGAKSATRKAAPKKAAVKKATPKKRVLAKAPAKKAAPKKAAPKKSTPQKPTPKKPTPPKKQPFRKPDPARTVAGKVQQLERGTQPLKPEQNDGRPVELSTPAPDEHPASPEQTDGSLNARPDARYDPTPDTNVPLPGHTSFDRDAQTARVAADKGRRIRLGNHKKR